MSNYSESCRWKMNWRVTKQIRSQMDLFGAEPSYIAHGSYLDKLFNACGLMLCGSRAAIMPVLPLGWAAQAAQGI